MSPLAIGIALSGGGARGIAHIGVLQALEENGIFPEVLSGTSAGAVVGALYASGRRPEEMLEFVKDATIWKIFKVTLPTMGLTKLTFLEDKLSAYLPDDRFEALQRKLFIAVCNLNSGQLEFRHSGSLIRTILASSAIPLFFQPVEIEGNWYVDGGLLDNMPIRPLVYADLDLIIGVNVMPCVDVPGKSVQGVIGIATRCFDLSIQANTRPNIELCDVYIEPKEVNHYNIFQFNKYQELYEMGYRAAKEKMPEILRRVEEGMERQAFLTRNEEG